MGLLGDSFDDPQTLATMQLAAGLLGPGSFGQALQRGLVGYQGSQQGSADLKLKGAALTKAQLDQALEKLQIDQQTRMFNLQTPFLEEAVRRLQAQQPGAPGVPAVPAVPAGNAGPSVMASAPGTVPPGSPTSPMNPAMQAPPAPQSAPQSTMFPGVSDNVAIGMIGTGGFAKLPETISKFNEPTDFTKLMQAAGIDPTSPLGRQIVQRQVAKQNYVAPVNAREGMIGRDPFTNQPLFFNPKIAPGGTPSFDGNGNVIGVSAIPGNTDVERSNAAAVAGGKAQFVPFSGRTATGEPAPVTSVATALGGPQQTTQRALDGIRAALPLMLAERAKMTPGPDRDAIDREINRHQNALLDGKPNTTTTTASPNAPASGALYADAPLGATTTANESAKDAVQNYNELHTYATTAAPRAIGLLQSIAELADKTTAGPGSTKLQLINGMLNTIGITPSPLATAAQNYQVLKKNANMLVGSQRMAATGGGSDALQALLEAANPNVAEMNAPALKEAAQELIAYNRMLMAKDRAMPNPTTVPTQKYQQAETAFAPFADPRLWQLEHAANDDERIRILSLMPVEERAAMIQKAKQARASGLLN